MRTGRTAIILVHSKLEMRRCSHRLVMCSSLVFCPRTASENFALREAPARFKEPKATAEGHLAAMLLRAVARRALSKVRRKLRPSAKNSSMATLRKRYLRSCTSRRSDQLQCRLR